MLRITNLIRNRNILKIVPLRSGPPGWSRPDPPPTARVPVQHELTDEQLLFHFKDRSMSEFILTQPEVYEGDTIMEAFPSLVRHLGIVLVYVFGIGVIMYFINPTKSNLAPSDEIIQIAEKSKARIESKQLTTLANENSIGIKLTADSFPKERVSNLALNANLESMRAHRKQFEQINSEVRAYLLKVKQSAQGKVRKDLEAHNNHDSHESHQEHSHH